MNQTFYQLNFIPEFNFPIYYLCPSPDSNPMHMRIFLWGLLSLFLFSSCATLLNRKYTSVRIVTEEPGKVKVNGLSLQTRPGGIDLPVERSKNPLVIDYQVDSVQKTFTVDRINSLAWYANIFTNYGLGMLIDKDNPRRYGYPRHVFISAQPEDIIPRRFNPFVPEGSLYWQFSIPYVNNFYLQPLNEGIQNSTGFWGIATSLEYFHSRDRSIALSTGVAIDFFMPIIAAVDYGGEWESAASAYYSLVFKQYHKRFNSGIGIHASRQHWQFNYNSFGDPAPPTRPTASRTHWTTGPVFLLGWQLGKHTWTALSYKPGFFRSGLPNAYEHVISLDFGTSIKLR